MDSNTVVSCPIVSTVGELKKLTLAKDRDNIAFMRLFNLLKALGTELPPDERLNVYSKNRGTGKVSQKTFKRVRDSYRAESFGTLVVAQVPYEDGVFAEEEEIKIVLGDGTSRSKGLLERFLAGLLTETELNRLISIQVVDKQFIDTYVDKGATDAHKNADKVTNSDLLVGKIAYQLEALIEPYRMPVSDNPSFYKKLEILLMAFNKGRFANADPSEAITAINEADAIWRKEAVDLPHYKSCDRADFKISAKFLQALSRYFEWRQELETSGNDYAVDLASNIGIFVVLMVDFLGDGPLSAKKTERLIENCNFGPLIGNNIAMLSLYNVFQKSTEKVSSTRKEIDETKKVYNNIVAIVGRRYVDSMPQAVRKT